MNPVRFIRLANILISVLVFVVIFTPNVKSYLWGAIVLTLCLICYSYQRSAEGLWVGISLLLIAISFY